MSKARFVPGYILAGSVAAGLAGAALGMAPAVQAASADDAAAQAIPDLSSHNMAWLRVGGDFVAPPSGPGPVTFDPDHPLLGRTVDAEGRDVSPTARVADTTNPILKPWAVEALKKANAVALTGTIAATPMSACWPPGVPLIMGFQEPMFIVQTPKEVTLIYQRDHHVRHVYMNVPHSAHVTPSWFGESVGQYENGELVVDTIGLSGKTWVDYYQTPHTDKMHVVERFHMKDAGKTLHIVFTVDDPDTFNMAWSASMDYHRVTNRLIESICAENNTDYFHGEMYPIPQADKPDF
jgi:hypothetical protein